MPITRVILCLCVLFSSVAPAAQAMESFAPVVERALPAVVNISTKQKITTDGSLFGGIPGLPNLPQGEGNEELEKFFERFGLPFGNEMPMEREVNSLGSGFVIDPEGYIVTNNHVIADATEIVVTFHDEVQLAAKVVGRDPKTDLALLKVDPKRPLPYVELGDSDKMRVGDWVIAIGNPFSLGSTVTAGIISARSRNINAGPFDDFLQTDAAINRGNSGGPMFNQYGEVIGVNTAIFSPSGGSVGIGFAIPTALAKPILEQLREYGRPYRGWLGVKIQHVTDEIANSLGLKEARGALVLEVTPEGPADEAGIESGDIILSFDGKDIQQMRLLPRIVAETPVGERVTVEVWRQNERERITLKLGEYPEEEQLISADSSTEAAPAQRTGTRVLGMYLRNMGEVDRNQFRLPENAKGVVIIGIEEDGIASKRSIQVGDVIIGVNQEKIATLEEFTSAVEEAREAERGYVLVRILRGNHSSYVTLPLKEE